MAEVISTMVQVHVARPDTAHHWLHLILLRSSTQTIYPGLWQCVTGRINPSEHSVRAARRELAEETGLLPRRMWTLPHVSTFYAHRLNAIVAVPVFGALVDADANVMLSDEHQQCRWLPVDEAVHQLVIPAQQQGLHLFDQLLRNSLNQDDFNEVYDISRIEY